MAKIIVNAPSGNQEIQEIEGTGGYFDPSLVIWDERVDGAMPAVVSTGLGGLVRQGNALAVDAALLAASQAKATQAGVDKSALATKRAARVGRIKAADIDNASLPQLKAILKDIVEDYLDKH